MGGTIGVAVFLSMLFSTVGDNIKDHMTSEARTPAFRQALASSLHDPQYMNDPKVAGILKGLANPKAGGSAMGNVSEDSSVIGRLPKAVGHPFEAGFAQSMDHVFLLAAGIALLGFLTLLLLPKIELRTQSASAMNRAQEGQNGSTPATSPSTAPAADLSKDGTPAVASSVPSPTTQGADTTTTTGRHTAPAVVGASGGQAASAQASGVPTAGAQAPGVGAEPAPVATHSVGTPHAAHQDAPVGMTPGAAGAETASTASGADEVDHTVGTAHGATATEELLGTTAAMCGGHTMDERCDDPAHQHEDPAVTRAIAEAEKRVAARRHGEEVDHRQPRHAAHDE